MEPRTWPLMMSTVCASMQEEVSAEVNVLLSLKKQYKDLTGEDFAPTAQLPSKPDTAAKAKPAEPAMKAEQEKKKQDQGKSAEKSDGSGKSEKQRLNEKGKAKTDTTSKLPSVQDSLVDKDGSGAREVKKVTR